MSVVFCQNQFMGYSFQELGLVTSATELASIDFYRRFYEAVMVFRGLGDRAQLEHDLKASIGESKIQAKLGVASEIQAFFQRHDLSYVHVKSFGAGIETIEKELENRFVSNGSIIESVDDGIEGGGLRNANGTIGQNRTMVYLLNQLVYAMSDDSLGTFLLELADGADEDSVLIIGDTSYLPWESGLTPLLGAKNLFITLFFFALYSTPSPAVKFFDRFHWQCWGYKRHSREIVNIAKKTGWNLIERTSSYGQTTYFFRSESTN